MTYADGTLLKGYNFYPVVRTIGFEPVLWDWKWYNDENSLTPTTSLAATNTAPTDIANQNVFKLRAVVSEVSGGTGTNVKFKLQYSEYADFSAEVYDVVATGSCVENSIWCYADGAGIDNAIIDQTVFANADACSGGVGDGCGTHNETAASSSATFDQPPLSNSEYEFTLKNSGARANAVYYFRLFDVQNQELVAASSSSPSLVVEGPQLTFTTEGVSAGATIEGVTADVTTTPTAIPFGSIPMDTEYEAVYRMNVDTSATEGFQLFMYQRQPLTNTDGEVIAGIAGTNASPVGWSTGCPASADGCFGYHAGDDTLAGGSSRFAPNDSYAALSTEPEEVMHSAIPSDNTAEIVFKLQIRPEQPAGDYQTEIVYLVVPSY